MSKALKNQCSEHCRREPGHSGKHVMPFTVDARALLKELALSISPKGDVPPGAAFGCALISGGFLRIAEAESLDEIQQVLWDMGYDRELRLLRGGQ